MTLEALAFVLLFRAPYGQIVHAETPNQFRTEAACVVERDKRNAEIMAHNRVKSVISAGVWYLCEARS